MTKTMCVEAGAQAVKYTTFRGYFESLTTGIVWHMPQTTSKVVYISASAPAPIHMALVTLPFLVLALNIALSRTFPRA